MTYTLTYESEIVNPMDSHEMGLLLEQSRNNNKRDNITGCLIYYMGGFIQVLEGEKTKVLDLYEKIKLDERHKNVHMFSEDDDVERAKSGECLARKAANNQITSLLFRPRGSGANYRL